MKSQWGAGVWAATQTVTHLFIPEIKSLMTSTLDKYHLAMVRLMEDWFKGQWNRYAMEEPDSDSGTTELEKQWNLDAGTKLTLKPIRRPLAKRKDPEQVASTNSKKVF